jgi:hypothetical protein
MLPPTFSFHEIYGKHRNPEEIRKMERDHQKLVARAYQYGNPVNTQEASEVETSAKQRDKRWAWRPRLYTVVLRFVSFFFS